MLCIYGDGDGALWMATRGGLSRFKDGRFTTYTVNDGLPVNFVHQILEDDAGNLWFSSNQGVFRVSKRELNDFAEGRTKKVTPVLYGVSDGMMTNTCSAGEQPAGWKGRDGRLWFATFKGVAVTDPSNVKINGVVPPVYVEEIVVDKRPVDLRRPADLRAGTEEVEIYYTALSFLAPEKVKFKYRLEGYDREWVDGDSRRTAKYTNLPPGSYRFMVKASNNDGLWNETGAAFAFSLRPHFYQTYWFYGLSVTLLSLLGYQLHRARLTRTEAQYAAVVSERNRMARELHDTLQQGLTGIALLLLKAAKANVGKSPAVAHQHLDNALNQVGSSVGDVRRCVWDLRSDALRRGGLVEALHKMGRHLPPGAFAQFNVYVLGAVRPLPATAEMSALGVAQEAVTNAVRHAAARHISIEVCFETCQVSLCVRDDGRGFDKEATLAAAAGHFGLLGMRERVEEVGGRLEINSKPGEGTEIAVSIPLRS